eukprot:1770505-Rhodomonas_salina.2
MALLRLENLALLGGTTNHPRRVLVACVVLVLYWTYGATRILVALCCTDVAYGAIRRCGRHSRETRGSVLHRAGDLA